MVPPQGCKSVAAAASAQPGFIAPAEKCQPLGLTLRIQVASCATQADMAMLEKTQPHALGHARQATSAPLAVECVTGTGATGTC